MQLITLTSDWGDAEFYASSVKARIIALNPSVQVVDISHNIQPHNILHAAYIIQNSWQHFPDGTIHIIGVQSETFKSRKLLLVKYKKHYFFGADNGIFSLLFDEEPDGIFDLTQLSINSFPELEVYPQVISQNLRNGEFIEPGPPIDSFRKVQNLNPVITGDKILGHIIHFDRYENAITNIKRNIFTQIQNNRKYTIYINSKFYSVSKISGQYHDVPLRELVAVFNSLDLLEIAICEGNLKSLLNLDSKSTIRVDFE